MAAMAVLVVAAAALWLCCAGRDAQAQAPTVELQVGFYAQSCPQAEVIVRDEVGRAVSADPGLAAGLLRLHFHDCFVRGCDASVLLDSAAANGSTAAEKDAAPNRTLRGFEVIDGAKKRLESACQGTVSCADILAFAARDSVVLTGGSPYGVPAGRRDGNESSASDAQASLPPPTANVAQLTQFFARNGLSQEDMVTLSGAHTIGVSHCSSFSARLYSSDNSNNTNTAHDPAMDDATASELARRCPPGSAHTVPMDLGGGGVPVDDNAFDTGYFQALLANRGLLGSDQALTADNATAALVAQNAANLYLFVTRFADAMVRMGAVRVLTGSDGQIRTNCRVVN